MREPSVSSDSAGIGFHYDLGNEFYRLWLDDTLTYSCGMWEGGANTLQDAQERKLDFYIDNLGLPAGGRLLDVGCGWGSLMLRAQRSIDRLACTGLTLSQRQAEWIADCVAAESGVDVLREDWMQHDPTARYDGAVCIGALEHFGTVGAGRRRRLETYRSFFDRMAGWLGDGRRLGLQTITVGRSPLNRADVDDVHFLMREVFPRSMLPRAEDLITAIGDNFRIVVMRDDAQDYERTCNAWRVRLEECHDQVVEIAGPETFVRYERYLRVAAKGFREGNLGLLRFILERHG